MKKDVNGVIVEMTTEEIEALEAEVVETPPTPEERIRVLEKAFIEFVGGGLNG